MKIISKIRFLLIAVLLSVGCAGCSDDDDKMLNLVGEEKPEFVLAQEFVKIKVGAENKVTVDVKQGGGEYNAFCLDSKIAKAEVVNGVVKVEGLANGRTSLIVSDKYNRYRKLPVSVYMTDKLQLSHEAFDLITPLGNSKTAKLNVLLGNGGYEVESDNPDVKVAVNEAGEISVTATSKKEEFTANVTVTDYEKLTASIVVTVKYSLEVFTDEELEAFKTDNSRRYYFKDVRTSEDYIDSYINATLDDGRQRYGWSHWGGFYHYYIDFAGDKSEGVKTEAAFSVKSWAVSGTYSEQLVTLKIVKNDATHLWGIFYFIEEDEEKIYTGYFCDTVNAN